MKIYLSFLQGFKEHPIPAYSFWGHYLRNGLHEAGHEVIEGEVDWALGIVPKNESAQKQWKDETWTKVVSCCRTQQPDLFLSYLYPEQIDTTAIQAIQSLGIRCVNFFCDNVRNFRKIPTEFFAFDLHWVPEFGALPMYEKWGLKTISAPMPMWIAPQYRYPIQVSEELDQISFIGSKDILRARFFVEASQQGVDVRIMGAGWEKNLGTNAPSFSNQQAGIGRKITNQWQQLQNDGLLPWFRKFTNRLFYPLPPDELLTNLIDPKPNFEAYIEFTRRSKIVLGINRYPCNHYSYGHPNTYSRLRDIEAPMMGACYLTEYVPGLEQWYELGTEIETYKNVEELKAKIEMLSKDSELRAKLRRNGQQRALKEHAIERTMDKIKLAL